MLDEMLLAKKKKMCWNCDGTIGFDASYCPYCGCDLAQGVDSKTMKAEKQADDNLSSLYTPPYSGNSDRLSNHYTEEMASNAVFQGDEEEPTTSMTEADFGVWPLLFLSFGGIMLTLGLLLFFFSEEGKVSLEWNAHYWFLYCLIATPLLMMGWKFLGNKKT